MGINKSGGYLIGKKDGKTIKHNDGDLGGLLVGKRHSEGGIKGINKSTNQPIEVEGGEIEIGSNALKSDKKNTLNGRTMTNREVLSKLNVDGGGVAFKEGGELSDNNKSHKVIDKRYGNPIEYNGGEVILTRGAVSNPKKYEFNGEKLTSKEIASRINEDGGGVSFDKGGKVKSDDNEDCGCNHYGKGGLLAPNGKQSNLTAEQYRLVRTPEFKAWFGDWENDANKMMTLDENGEPMVFWHTGGEWYELNKEIGNGELFFSITETIYSESNYQSSIKRPFFLKSDYIYVIKYEKRHNQSAKSNIKNKEYPIWFIQGVNFVIVKNSEQIKLADGTNTTFDGSNPDIRYADGGSTEIVMFGIQYPELTPSEMLDKMFEDNCEIHELDNVYDKGGLVRLVDKKVASYKEFLSKNPNISASAQKKSYKNYLSNVHSLIFDELPQQMRMGLLLGNQKLINNYLNS